MELLLIPLDLLANRVDFSSRVFSRYYFEDTHYLIQSKGRQREAGVSKKEEMAASLKIIVMGVGGVGRNLIDFSSSFFISFFNLLRREICNYKSICRWSLD